MRRREYIFLCILSPQVFILLVHVVADRASEMDAVRGDKRAKQVADLAWFDNLTSF